MTSLFTEGTFHAVELSLLIDVNLVFDLVVDFLFWFLVLKNKLEKSTILVKYIYSLLHYPLDVWLEFLGIPHT